MRVDDLLASIAIGVQGFSPDGLVLAFEQKRAILDEPAALQNVFLSEGVHSDIWLQDAPGHPARNLSNGRTDGTGAWAPMWAPDGQHLAFLSTRGSEETSLWMWDRRRNQARRLPTPGVRDGGSDPSCRWVDAQRILCLVAADGDVALPETPQGRYVRLTMAAWARAKKAERTADVLKSTEFEAAPHQLWLVNIDTGHGQSVGMTRRAPSLSYDATWLSPDGRLLAYIKPDATPYNHEIGMRMGVPVSLGLTALDDRNVVLKDPLPENIHSATLKWSPDSKELAFFANGAGPVDPILLFGTAGAAAMPIEPVSVKGNPAKFYRLSIVTGTVTEWATGEIDLGVLGSPEFFWTNDGEIIVSAPQRQYGVSTGAPPSRGAPWGASTANAVSVFPPPTTFWWVINRNGRSRRLAAEGAALPLSLRPIDGGRAFVGVRDGEVWSVDPKTGTATNLTATFELPVSGITSVVNAPTGTQLLLGVKRFQTPVQGSGGSSQTRSHSDVDYVFDIAAGTAIALKRPNEYARLRAYAPSTQNATYMVDSRDGLYLWRSGARQKPELVLEANTYYRSIAATQRQKFSYTSLNGEPLAAELILPADYVKGRLYPVVVDVYYGTIVSPASPTPPPEPAPRPVHEEVMTSAGYAVLMPSIPVRLPNALPEEGDSALMALNGILPAVEKSVSLGLVDPQRVFIQGGSRGGWTALATIGLTTRFKAAISAAYGEGARMGALDHNTKNQFAEQGEMRFVDPNGGLFKDFRPSDVPWWRDGDMFRRNHPLSWVDRVQTPVMLMHGDVDVNTAIDATEDYFFALVSMRKPAELVRYMGEGHANRVPANVRDEYQRRFAWFDRWGDISRDANGDMIYEGDHVKSRNGAPPLTPEDFARIGPAAPSKGSSVPTSASR